MNEVPGGSAERKPKRRWLQFSLRMMFVVITLSALLLGLGMWRIGQREQAIDSIRKLGGSVMFGREAPTPDWLKRVVFPKIVVVDLAGTGATNADLARLKGFLKPVRTLKLDRTKITPGALEHIASFSELETLTLAGTSLADADLVHLRQLENLVVLDLSGTPVTDAGLEHLAGLARLEFLDLFDTRVTDAGLRHLRGLTALGRLRLEEAQISSAGVGHLEGLPSLESVTVQVHGGTGKQARDLLQALPRVHSAGLLRPDDPAIWGSAQSWEKTPAGVAEAILSRVQLGPEEAIKLLEALADANTRRRWDAPSPFAPHTKPVLAEEDRVQSVEEFIDVLKDGGSNPHNFLRTWVYAGSDAARQAIPALVEMLEDPDYEVRRRSAFILVRIGLDSQRVADAIARLLKDDDPRMRAITAYTFDGTGAVYSYGDVGPRIGPEAAKVAIPMLVALSEDEYWEARSASADGLGSIAQVNPETAATVIPVLLKMLQDKSPYVNVPPDLKHATQGNPKEAKAALPALFDLLRAEDPQLRARAVRALGLVAQNLRGEAGDATGALIERLSDKAVSYQLPEALGHVVEGSPDEVETIIPALLNALQNGDEPTRNVAYTALSEIADAIIAHDADQP